jgi:hypothetical protein
VLLHETLVSPPRHARSLYRVALDADGDLVAGNSGSRSPTFANSIISLATAIVAGSLRSTNPSLPQCGGHRCDVFWPKRVIALEKWSNRHGKASGQE